MPTWHSSSVKRFNGIIFSFSHKIQHRVMLDTNTMPDLMSFVYNQHCQWYCRNNSNKKQYPARSLALFLAEVIRHQYGYPATENGASTSYKAEFG
jgi:hypothetical protein